MSLEYTLESYELDNTTGTYTRQGEITTFANLQFTLKANYVWSMTFELNIYSPDNTLTIPFKNWVLLKRNDTALALFNIVDVQGSSETDTGSSVFTCFDVHYSLVNIIYEGRYFADKDASLIAQDYINYAQNKGNSNFGIQVGVLETVGDTTDTLFYQSVGQAIINQTDNIIGYDFLYTPILDSNGKLDYIKFDLYKSLGVLRDNLPPLEIGYSVNQVTYGLKQELYNNIYSQGEGTGDVSTAIAFDATSASVFSRREQVTKEANITVLSTLQTKADNELLNTKSIQLELGFQLTEGVSPYYGEFGLFDILNCNIEVGNTIFNYKGNAKITELNFVYNEQDNKEVITPIITYSI